MLTPFGFEENFGSELDEIFNDPDNARYSLIAGLFNTWELFFQPRDKSFFDISIFLKKNGRIFCPNGRIREIKIVTKSSGFCGFCGILINYNYARYYE